jgi:hypothetical protein
LLERAYGEKEKTKEKEGHTQTADESAGDSQSKVKRNCSFIVSADGPAVGAFPFRPSIYFYERRKSEICLTSLQKDRL